MLLGTEECTSPALHLMMMSLQPDDLPDTFDLMIYLTLLT
jgi:hypothetical protein